MNNKTKAEKINQCVMLNLIRHLQRLPLLLVNNMRRRFQTKFGMTHLYNNGGFTLVELLVVVLIIGILAAVALPQYQKAVLKSRASTILGVLSGLVQAEEVYFVANGEYTTDARLLDIEMPGECNLNEIDKNEGTYWACGDSFMVALDTHGQVAAAIYCPKKNEGAVGNCLADSVFQLGFATSRSRNGRTPPNTRRCWVPLSSTNGKGNESVCRALGKGPIECEGATCYEIY